MTTIEERSWDAAVRRMQGDSVYALGYKDGATEQRAIDDAELAEVRKQRDAYYDELLKLRAERLEWISKAVAWVDHNVGTLTAIALRKAMED